MSGPVAIGNELRRVGGLVEARRWGWPRTATPHHRVAPPSGSLEARALGAGALTSLLLAGADEDRAQSVGCAMTNGVRPRRPTSPCRVHTNDPAATIPGLRQGRDKRLLSCGDMWAGTRTRRDREGVESLIMSGSSYPHCHLATSRVWYTPGDSGARPRLVRSSTSVALGTGHSTASSRRQTGPPSRRRRRPRM